jgi:hypothetical protein
VAIVAVGSLAAVVPVHGTVAPPLRFEIASSHVVVSALCGNPAPEEVYPVLFSKLPGDVVRMVWPAQAGYHTDIVRGSITALSVTAGDFSIATERCVIDDSAAEVFDDPAVPIAGEGYWYLLREDQYNYGEGCPMGQGTYNFRQFGAQSRQVGDRNPPIRMSGRECPCNFFPVDPGTCTVWYP